MQYVLNGNKRLLSLCSWFYMSPVSFAALIGGLVLKSADIYINKTSLK
jgi:hypothetical protein